MDLYPQVPSQGPQEDDMAFIRMYTKSTVRVKKTVLDYTWLSMLAEIGGYTGLLLGISVVNLTRVIERVFEKFQASPSLQLPY